VVQRKYWVSLLLPLFPSALIILSFYLQDTSLLEKGKLSSNFYEDWSGTLLLFLL